MDEELVNRWTPPKFGVYNHDSERRKSNVAYLAAHGLKFEDVDAFDRGFDGEAWVTEFTRKDL